MAILIFAPPSKTFSPANFLTPMSSTPAPSLAPHRAIALIGALEFIYILDFMTALPLAPDLVLALGFSPDRIGWLTASYTLAAVLAGLLAVPLLDRFDRRSVLLTAIVGLGLATLAATQATGLISLLLARALTGFCGAPAVAVGMAIVIDATPPEKRGAAIAKVMMGLSAAIIAGVPAALELAHWGGWKTPFYTVASLSLILWLAAYAVLPPLRAHMGRAAPISIHTLLSRPLVRVACVLQASSQLAAFLIVPSFSAFFLFNLGYPRAELGSLYLVGGIFAFATVQVCGRLTDHYGPYQNALAATVSFIIGLAPLAGFVSNSSAVPLMLFFVLFMAGNAARNISLAATTSQIPAPHERAGFMALQNMVQDLAISFAAGLASLFLSTDSQGHLLGMQTVVIMAATCAAAVVPVLVRLLQMRDAEPATLAAKSS